jgi:cytochrome P450
VVPWVRRLITEQLGRLLVKRGPGEKLVDFLAYFHTAVDSELLGIAPQSDLEQPAFIAARQRVLELAQEIIDVHRAQPPDERGRDVVDDIFNAVEQSPDLLAERDILVSAIIPYIAGLGTLVYTTSFLFHTLLAHPGVLQRVTAEVDHAWEQGGLTKESLKAMPALHGAAMETLRMYQTTSAWDGVARKTFAFEGYRVEEGSQVFGATTVSHFLPHIFAEPETFDVDRYFEPRNEHRQHGAFAAFGIGDHSCIGAGIAEIQLAVTFATILRDYRWQSTTGSAHPTIVPALTPAPSDDFSIIVQER